MKGCGQFLQQMPVEDMLVCDMYHIPFMCHNQLNTHDMTFSVAINKNNHYITGMFSMMNIAKNHKKGLLAIL